MAHVQSRRRHSRTNFSDPIMIYRRRSIGAAPALGRSVSLAALCAVVGATGCVPPTTSMYAAKSASADSLVRAAIAQERTLNAQNIPLNTVSIAPLTVIAADTSLSSLGFGLSSLLAVDLARSAKLTVVERLRIDAVLRELKLAQSGRVDTTTAPRVGRLLGARKVVIGSIDLRPNGNMSLRSYVADATRGSISAPLTGTSTLTQVFDAEKTLAFRLFDALGVTLTPAERRLVEQQPTKSLTAFLAYGRGARAEANRDFAGALSFYSQAVSIDPNFTLAGDRVSLLQTQAPALRGGGLSGLNGLGSLGSLGRIGSLTTDLINRPGPITLGTGADAPAASLQQLVTFTIIIRTP